jgi:hypothetical protein
MRRARRRKRTYVSATLVIGRFSLGCWIPAFAGMTKPLLDSRLRGNDEATHFVFAAVRLFRAVRGVTTRSLRTSSTAGPSIDSNFPC